MSYVGWVLERIWNAERHRLNSGPNPRNRLSDTPDLSVSNFLGTRETLVSQRLTDISTRVLKYWETGFGRRVVLYCKWSIDIIACVHLNSGSLPRTKNSNPTRSAMLTLAKLRQVNMLPGRMRYAAEPRNNDAFLHVG